jgi:tRNA(fMet)-specific endonuclease VapC
VSLTLDSNVVIEILRGRQPHYRARMDEAKAADISLHVSSVVLHELAVGALRSQRPAFHLDRLDAFVAEVEVDAWTGEDAMAAARVRFDLESNGQGIGTYDTLIAGQAVNRGRTVVTNSLREFIRVPHLDLLDWSDPTGPRDRSEASWLQLMRRPAK